jgi:type VI secretion system secreted protein VgrG
MLRLKPYDDQTGNSVATWIKGTTIGYGHLVSAGEWIKYKSGIAEMQADDLFRADVAPFERAVGEVISTGLQQYQFDALVIFCFNIGIEGFRNSKVAQLINAPDSATQAAALEVALEGAWKSWNKSQGKFSAGLVNRRAAEWRIYTEAVYARW